MKPHILMYPDPIAEWKRRWEAGMKKAALKRRQTKKTQTPVGNSRQ